MEEPEMPWLSGTEGDAIGVDTRHCTLLQALTAPTGASPEFLILGDYGMSVWLICCHKCTTLQDGVEMGRLSTRRESGYTGVPSLLSETEAALKNKIIQRN